MRPRWPLVPRRSKPYREGDLDFFPLTVGVHKLDKTSQTCGGENLVPMVTVAHEGDEARAAVLGREGHPRVRLEGRLHEARPR